MPKPTQDIPAQRDTKKPPGLERIRTQGPNVPAVKVDAPDHVDTVTGQFLASIFL